MKRFKILPLVASLAVALGFASNAQATAYALSSDNVVNFSINETGNVLFGTIIDTSTTSAILDGVGAGPNGGAGTTDALLALTANSTVGPAGENSFVPLGIIAGAKYAYADALINTATLANPDFDARNIAEALLNPGLSGSGDANNSSATGFTVDFTVVGAPASIAFAFTADPLIQVLVNAPGTFAQGVLTASLTITCTQVGGCGTVGTPGFTAQGGIVTSWIMNGSVDPSGVTGTVGGTETLDGENLNVTITQFGNGAQNHSLAAGFASYAMTTGDLFAGTYSLGLAMSEAVDVLANRVPEPASMALLGLGLMGMGFVGRRNKKA